MKWDSSSEWHATHNRGPQQSEMVSMATLVKLARITKALTALQNVTSAV
jgi:hypothetical protein